MPIPLRITSVKLVDKWPKHIIIHHTSEFSYGLTSRIDTSKFQTNKYELGYYRKKKELVTPYHFIIERIENDFFPVISRPIFTKVKFDDIPEEYDSAVHIGMYGDYNNDLLPVRAYQVTAFKVIFPLVMMFKIPEENILLHREVSMNEEETCPGEFFDKRILISSYRKFKRFKSIRRV